MLREGRSWSGRERNNAFLNTRDGRFANVAATTGFDLPDDARAAVVVDWDQDGDQDVWVSNRNEPRLRLLRNDGAPTSSVSLFLVGNGTTTNTDAVGARATLETEGPRARLVRAVRAGEGYLAQSSRWLHFGLGAGARAVRLTMAWPAGGAEEFAGIEAPGRYRLVQGTGRAERLPQPGAASVLRPSVPGLPQPTSEARVPLVSLLRLPKPLPYTRLDGTTAQLEPGSGRPLLLNLFASWCAPCAGELEGFARDAAAFQAAGVDVLALAVDGLGDERSDPARVAELLERVRFPFPAGRASAPIVSVLQALNDTHVALHRPLPVPVSFLLDGSGRLSVIYKGPVKAEQVIRDVAHSTGTRRDRWLRSAPLGGRALDSPAVEEAARLTEASQRFLFALSLAEKGRFEDARAHLEDLVALKPDFPEAQNNLGLALFRLGRDTEAERAFQAALAGRSGMAEAHYNLGALHDRRGEVAKAEARYREVLRLKPEYPEAHNALGLLCAKAGRLDEARRLFEREVEVNPTFAEAHNNVGLVHLGQGRLAEAHGFFEAALKLAPGHADAHNNLGVVLKRQGRVEDAIRHYEQAIAANPRFAEAWNNLGLANLSLGRTGPARSAFEQALGADPAFEPARRNLEKVQTGGR